MGADFAALKTNDVPARHDGPAGLVPGLVRRLPVGAEAQPGGGVHFRVWAPRVHRIAVEIDGAPPVPLQEEGGASHWGLVPDAGPGMRYGFRTDTLDRLLPDPVSRFQPEGPHGP